MGKKPLEEFSDLCQFYNFGPYKKYHKRWRDILTVVWFTVYLAMAIIIAIVTVRRGDIENILTILLIVAFLSLVVYEAIKQLVLGNQAQRGRNELGYHLIQNGCQDGDALDFYIDMCRGELTYHPTMVLETIINDFLMACIIPFYSGEWAVCITLAANKKSIDDLTSALGWTTFIVVLIIGIKAVFTFRNGKDSVSKNCVYVLLNDLLFLRTEQKRGFWAAEK